MRLGTRASALALAQSRLVRARLEALGEDVEVVEITTGGDERPGGAPAPAPPTDKARFVTELEQALLAGEIDLAVHSAKDVPAELPEGLTIAGVPERADARDALCGADDARRAARRGRGRHREPAPARAAAGRPPGPRRRGGPRQRRHAAAQARGGRLRGARAGARRPRPARPLRGGPADRQHGDGPGRRPGLPDPRDPRAATRHRRAGGAAHRPRGAGGADRRAGIGRRARRHLQHAGRRATPRTATAACTSRRSSAPRTAAPGSATPSRAIPPPPPTPVWRSPNGCSRQVRVTCSRAAEAAATE